jgi:hypothetical protein
MADIRGPNSALRRGLWFVALWAAGVGTLLVVSFAIKLWLR